jgi:uncharacterized peroxidase-related enzyme
MPRLPPLRIEELPPDLAAIVRSAEDYMGFVANDALTMAWKPEMLRAALPFMRSIYREDKVSFALKRLVGMMASWSAGCGYCVAHTAHGAARLGTSETKIAALAAFETDPQFTAAERAALRVARSAGQVPNAVSDVEWADLRAHFDAEQTVEIVAVIALFGFLNRWNATLATELESSPLTFASRVLRPSGWQSGPHG